MAFQKRDVTTIKNEYNSLKYLIKKDDDTDLIKETDDDHAHHQF